MVPVYRSLRLPLIAAAPLLAPHAAATGLVLTDADGVPFAKKVGYGGTPAKDYIADLTKSAAPTAADCCKKNRRWIRVMDHLPLNQ